MSSRKISSFWLQNLKGKDNLGFRSR